MLTGELTIEDAAVEAAGNWQRFDSFCWFRRDEVPDAENWAIFYTSHRDSGLLDQSNAAAIVKEMTLFTEGDDPDVVFESHNHWAVGHIDGFSLQVFRSGEITDAFVKYHGLAERLADYPILDEEDYSQREFDATIENLTDAIWRLKDEYDLPKDWESDVFNWLSNHNCGAIENVDDQGGYPDEDELKQAFEALEFQQSA
ncbi:hypothetical protein Pan258_29320 [Symmachiella dynata]|uniref:hypothetical protein n=1 Tax=Symmachiella dynata TaxID=2527995 RepID=UPI00118CC92E|nr:hypothetical protein [Symmachiella dynata]QDT48885.1 hypothetical protein Pan258_29320 [Symmachiella dynata]